MRRRAMGETMTDTHVPAAPAVAWEYTGRDWRPL